VSSVSDENGRVEQTLESGICDHLAPSGRNALPQAEPVEALSRRDTSVDGQKGFDRLSLRKLGLITTTLLKRRVLKEEAT
jgi:hypothetical protein